MFSFDEMVIFFEKANSKFVKDHKMLIYNDVSERCLCGALSQCFFSHMLNDKRYNGYFADVEYNRNDGRIKTILNAKFNVINITCDLIIHSRGTNVEQDNLIAIEMKKTNRFEEEKQKDKERLMALTKDSFDDTWSYDGKTLPEFVCRYVLGVYYELDYYMNLIHIEYYAKGKLVKKYDIKY